MLDLIRAAALETKQDGRYAYIAPFFNQAKDVAWIYLKRFAQPLIAKVNEGDCFVELFNGARIRIYGADNPDRLRGGYLDGVVLDEYADMYPSVWGEIIRPMLSDREGWATFIGTPKGRNAFYDRLTRAKQEGWFWDVLPASKTGILSADELAEAAKDMTPEQTAQEFECSFDAAIIGAYYGKEIAAAERDGRITDVPVSPDLLVHTAWDLGHGDSTAIWFFQVGLGQIRVVDHYENHGQALAHYAAVLAGKGYRYGKHFLPHDAKVHELGTGRTRVETLGKLGLKADLVPMHKVEDGINAARVTMARIWFDEVNCRSGIEALRQYRTDYDEKKRAFRDTPRHDWTSHTADAFRYLCMSWREMAAIPTGPKAPKLLGVGAANQVSLDDMLRANGVRL